MIDLSKLKVRPTRGRPPKDPSERVKKIFFYATPWVARALEYIEEAEKAKGKKLKTSEIIRRLLQLGIERYRELGDIPTRDR